MVPSVYIAMDALPLTANGKVDFRALPAADGPVGGNPYVAPRDPTEQALVEVWSEVLGVERVGVEDNFFELGGDSILSVQLAAKASRAFGITVSPRELFDQPTVSALAGEIQNKILLMVERAAASVDGTELGGGA
jgi:acyl carrier protein